MPVSPYLEIHTVTLATISQNTMTVSLKIAASGMNKAVETPAMIDCGAGGKFIDQNYARQFEVKKMDQPHKVYNVDGTENKKGMIKSYVDLEFTINNKKFTE